MIIVYDICVVSMKKTLKEDTLNKPVDQQESGEYQEMNSHGDNYLIFKKDVKNIHWRKKMSLFNKWCWRTRYLHEKERNKICISHLEYPST